MYNFYKIYTQDAWPDEPVLSRIPGRVVVTYRGCSPLAGPDYYCSLVAVPAVGSWERWLPVCVPYPGGWQGEPCAVRLTLKQARTHSSIPRRCTMPCLVEPPDGLREYMATDYNYASIRHGIDVAPRFGIGAAIVDWLGAGSGPLPGHRRLYLTCRCGAPGVIGVTVVPRKEFAFRVNACGSQCGCAHTVGIFPQLPGDVVETFAPTSLSITWAGEA